MMEEIRLPQTPPLEALRVFKKGGLAGIRDDLHPDAYQYFGVTEKGLFRKGEVYRVFAVQEDGVWLGPSDASQKDIDEFEPNRAAAKRESRYGLVLFFETDLLLPVH